MEGRPEICGGIDVGSIAYDDAEMNIILYEVGKRIGEERRKRNLTRVMLADRANMTSNSIYKMENYLCNPRLRSILRISCALGVDFGILVPTEKRNQILSNGDRFEQITKNESASTINFLLNQAERFIQMNL